MNCDCRDFEQGVEKWYLVGRQNISIGTTNRHGNNKTTSVGKVKRKIMRH
jgi:tRNA A37 threonylcarbamoyladenosine dehydratase